MNKLRILLLGSVCSLGFSLPLFADQVQGFVEAVDPADNSILIKDPVTGTGKAVHVHPKVIAGVKKGSIAKATLKAGTDEAETLEVLGPRE